MLDSIVVSAVMTSIKWLSTWTIASPVVNPQRSDGITAGIQAVVGGSQTALLDTEEKEQE